MGHLCGTVLFLFCWAPEAEISASRDSSPCPALQGTIKTSIMQLSGSNCCHDTVCSYPLHCPLDTTLNLIQRWLPVTSYFSSVECERKALAQHSNFSSPLSRTNLGLGFPEGRDLCATEGREVGTHIKKSSSSCWVKSCGLKNNRLIPVSWSLVKLRDFSWFVLAVNAFQINLCV